MLRLKFETLTPLFIGSGNILERDFHYKIDNVFLLKYNEKKIIENLAVNRVIDFKKEQTSEAIKKSIIDQNYRDDEFFEYEVKFSNSFKDYICNPNNTGNDEVKEFVNVHGKFYIPGSSIKGALCNILHKENLGISESISERFVIRDIIDLNNDDFLVFHYDRPPYSNLIALKTGVKFSCLMAKLGGLTKELIEINLTSYIKDQIDTALEEMETYAIMNGIDEFPMLDIFKSLQSNYQNKMIINVGFGGGSWFKIERGGVPKFRKKGSIDYEIPTTTYYMGTFDEYTHIGWCSVEVEEC